MKMARLQVVIFTLVLCPGLLLIVKGNLTYGLDSFDNSIPPVCLL